LLAPAYALRATARQPSRLRWLAEPKRRRREGWWEAERIELPAAKGPRLQRGDGTSRPYWRFPKLIVCCARLRGASRATARQPSRPGRLAEPKRP
jgi:hypothetical protein